MIRNGVNGNALENALYLFVSSKAKNKINVNAPNKRNEMVIALKIAGQPTSNPKIVPVVTSPKPNATSSML